MTAHRPFCCCIAEGDLFTGDATRRKIRCLHEILRGVTGVPPALRDSLLQADEVLFLPSPSLQNVNKRVIGKEDTHFIERWGRKLFKNSATGKHKAQATERRQQRSCLPSTTSWEDCKPQTAQSQRASCFYSFLRWQPALVLI